MSVPTYLGNPIVKIPHGTTAYVKVKTKHSGKSPTFSAYRGKTGHFGINPKGRYLSVNGKQFYWEPENFWAETETEKNYRLYYNPHWPTGPDHILVTPKEYWRIKIHTYFTNLVALSLAVAVIWVLLMITTTEGSEYPFWVTIGGFISTFWILIAMKILKIK